MDQYPELIKLRGRILSSGKSLDEISKQAKLSKEIVRVIASGQAQNTSLKTMYAINDAITALKKRAA